MSVAVSVARVRVSVLSHPRMAGSTTQQLQLPPPPLLLPGNCDVDGGLKTACMQRSHSFTSGPPHRTQMSPAGRRRIDRRAEADARLTHAPFPCPTLTYTGRRVRGGGPP